jgi:enoyl-CoA hydratase/carnithine racemase
MRCDFLSVINISVKDVVLEAELNRPQVINAINNDMAIALCELVERAKEPDVRSVLLYGSGRGFCAGGDLKDMGIDQANTIEVREFLQRCHTDLKGLLDYEALAQSVIFQSEDHVEGKKAFNEKEHRNLKAVKLKTFYQSFYGGARCINH